MKYKTISRYWIKSGMIGLLLSGLLTMANAANIAYVPKTGPESPAAGKKWPTTRFVVNGDCVTDNLTGLMWAKDGYLFYPASWGSSTTAGTAQYKIAQMNTNSTATAYHLCGYSDWRLPNINELGSLVNYTYTKQVSWLNSQGFINVQPDRYWSSTAYAGDSSNAWMLSAVGRSYYDYVSTDCYILPVRGGR